jgi:chemosensory pili system protein ChpA (sensor histidine kinase/response regulator)
MSQEKEREIQLQFLEEAWDYLDTIESVLLGLANQSISSQDMDGVLRAAHSVKGGAGMMGFKPLSHLAHRLEDSFKVLKAQRNSLDIDAQLEHLLLAAVDRLRRVVTLNRQGTDAEEEWLAQEATPIFEQLHQRLGDPVADDAATMLGADDGTNVAALLFETEVEGCLGRLESVLADPQAPCLEEELSIMAQELGGLGEMLQLDAFSQLCESILHQLELAPGQVRDIAQASLQAWRRSQALVLVGQVGSLPTAIEASVAASTASPEPAAPDAVEEAVEEPDFNEQLAAEFEVYWSEADRAFAPEPANSSEVTEVGAAFDADPSTPLRVSTERSQGAETEESEAGETFAAEFDIAAEFEAAASDSPSHETAPHAHPAFTEADASEEAEEPVTVASGQASLSRNVQRMSNETQDVDLRTSDIRAESATAPPQRETQENTVRIPVRQLDRLNDLFGELTIERNGLSLQLARLRNLMGTLSRRVSILDQSNLRLRTTYDTVATQSARPALISSLVTASTTKRTNDVSESGSVTYFDAGGSGGRDTPSNPSHRFDALEMDRYNDLHLLSMEVMETIVQIQEVTSDIGLGLEDTDQTARELNRTARQLQTNLNRIRMRPLSDLVGRFSRALRELCLEYDKQVELKVVGKGTLIDRSILEALSDPLMHLVRNAFDHGIESPQARQAQGKPPKGTIEIKAAHRGNQTIITISDDGNGINLNKIRARAEAMGLDAELLAAASEDELLSLIFEPGFSTADRVTDLSGRGVGMDVVRNNLKQIRGDIRVDTQPGKGTTFTLTLPFTLSVARVLLVESNNMLLAFPTDVIEEMLLFEPEQVLTVAGSEVLKWDEEMIPLTRLGTWLKFYCPRRVTTPEDIPSISEPTVLTITQGDQPVALQVDRCWGEREVAIRQVEGPLAMPPGFTSCTILGDGKVVPLVDIGELLRWIASERAPQSESASPSHLAQLSASVANLAPLADTPQSHKETILVVDDSINVRRFLALALEKAGYLVEQAKDGQDAVEKLLGGLQVQAVICDIEMPRLDGYGFLAQIKSDPAFSDLPVAMLTSRSGDKHRQLAMTLGATAYFSKPYNERELLQTLRQLINAQLTA